MKAKILLRVASALMLVHLFGHSVGKNGWKTDSDPLQKQVAHWMTGYKFPFMGVNRSMGDYFDGYGFIASICLAIFVVLLWITSNYIDLPNRFLKANILTLGFALMGISTIEFIYFFPFAAILTLMACILVMISYFLMTPEPG